MPTQKQLRNNLIELEERVRKYFDEHVYAGYTRPFHLEEIQMSPLNRHVLYAVPEEKLDEEISSIDKAYETGLAEVGAKLHLAVKLPYWVYMK